MLKRKNCHYLVRRAHLLRDFDRTKGRITFAWEEFFLQTKIKFKRIPLPTSYVLPLGKPLKDGEYTLWFRRSTLEVKKRKQWYSIFHEFRMINILAINWNTWNALVVIESLDKHHNRVTRKEILPMNFSGYNEHFGYIFWMEKSF